MTSLEEVAATIRAMDDGVLVERWRQAMFSDEAEPIARAELERRNISAPERLNVDASAIPAQRARRPIFTLYLPVILLNVLAAGLFFSGSSRGPFESLRHALQHPSYFIDLLAGGAGAYLVYFVGGMIIEMIVCAFKKRRLSLKGCLLWSTALLLFVILTR